MACALQDGRTELVPGDVSDQLVLDDRTLIARETEVISRLSWKECRLSPPRVVGRWKKAQMVHVGRRRAFFTFFLTSESSLAVQEQLRREVESWYVALDIAKILITSIFC